MSVISWNGSTTRMQTKNVRLVRARSATDYPEEQGQQPRAHFPRIAGALAVAALAWVFGLGRVGRDLDEQVETAALRACRQKMCAWVRLSDRVCEGGNEHRSATAVPEEQGQRLWAHFRSVAVAPKVAALAGALTSGAIKHHCETVAVGVIGLISGNILYLFGVCFVCSHDTNIVNLCRCYCPDKFLLEWAIAGHFYDIIFLHQKF